MPVRLIPKGAGRVDYSVNIGQSTASAAMVKEYNLSPNEKLKLFQVAFCDDTSAYPWFRPPLAPGESTHLIDGENGLPTPYTVPAGYDLWVMKHWFNSNESVKLQVFFDGNPLGVMFPGDLNTYIEQEVALFKVSWFDPTLSNEHTVDAVVINEGESYAHGTAQIICVLKKVR